MIYWDRYFVQRWITRTWFLWPTVIPNLPVQFSLVKSHLFILALYSSATGHFRMVSRNIYRLTTGLKFVRKFFTVFWLLFGAKKLTATSYHLQTKGPVGRYNCTCIARLCNSLSNIRKAEISSYNHWYMRTATTRTFSFNVILLHESSTAAPFDGQPGPVNDMQGDVTPRPTPHRFLQQIELRNVQSQADYPRPKGSINTTLIRMYGGYRHSK